MSTPAAHACRIGVTPDGADAGAGSAYQRIVFTNIGSSPCRLNGAARFEYVGSDRSTVVGEPAAPGGGVGLLAPGHAVTTTMRAGDPGNYDEDRCRPVPVSGVRVTPPADAEPTVVRPLFPTTCTGGRVDVQPLTNGDGEGPG